MANGRWAHDKEKTIDIVPEDLIERHKNYPAKACGDCSERIIYPDRFYSTGFCDEGGESRKEMFMFNGDDCPLCGDTVVVDLESILYGTDNNAVGSECIYECAGCDTRWVE